MKKGKLIVIDGIDGVGKATQTKLLVSNLRKAGLKVKTIDFPHYDGNFFGSLIGRYLAGKFGDFIQVDPHLASVLYAADRFESSKKMKQWLEDGYAVICDRYVSANQIHQGGKIHDAKKRKVFFEWLEKMEHGVFDIPRPDMIFYLDVPLDVSQKWLKRKVAQRKKGYLKGRHDVAEDNLEHLEDSRRAAVKLVEGKNKWKRINCWGSDEIRSREDIAGEIFDTARKICCV
jgi:dTMP kinase